MSVLFANGYVCLLFGGKRVGLYFLLSWLVALLMNECKVDILKSIREQSSNKYRTIDGPHMESKLTRPCEKARANSNDFPFCQC